MKKKVLKLTEQDIRRIVEKVLSETEDETQFAEPDPKEFPDLAINYSQPHQSSMAEEEDEDN